MYCFDCALLPKEKKGNERAGSEKGKIRQDVLTSLFAVSLLLSSQLIFFFHLSLFTCMSFVVVVVKINKNLKKTALYPGISLNEKAGRGNRREVWQISYGGKSNGTQVQNLKK